MEHMCEEMSKAALVASAKTAASAILTYPDSSTAPSCSSLQFRPSLRTHAALAQPLEDGDEHEGQPEWDSEAATEVRGHRAFTDSMHLHQLQAFRQHQRQHKQPASLEQRHSAQHQVAQPFQVVYSQAIADSKAGHFLKAFSALTCLVEADSDQPTGTVMHLVARAHVARKLHRPQVALNDLLQARALDPTDPLVASNLARLFEDKAAFHNAVQLYSSAIEAVPNEAAFWVRRGYVQMKLNKHQLALQDFERAIQVCFFWVYHACPCLNVLSSALHKIGPIKEEGIHLCAGHDSA